MAKKRTTSRTANEQKAAADREMMRRVDNALMSRADLIKSLMEPRRDIYDECGYPATGGISASDYRELYDRMAIATRVVEVMPQESWCVSPQLVEVDDVEDHEPTAFEQAWVEAGKSLTVQEKSWLESEKTHPLLDYLQRIDVMSGICSYGVMLLGFDDGKPLQAPVEYKKGMGLLYVRVFDETLAKISKYETDETNRRFGRPIEYTLTLHDSAGTDTIATLPTKEVAVHWTRVIHVADNLGSSELFAVPRIRPVLNNILALQKIYGASAEGYWRSSFPGLSIESHPQLQGEVKIDRDAMKDQLEQYQNTLQKYLLLIGLTAKPIAPQVVDPTPEVDVQITAICVEMGIPKRIFMGSERGELSSGQDAKAWNGRLMRRQTRYITPRLIAPLVDRLIWVGALPEPASYSIRWPNLDALTEEEKAKVAQLRADAMAKYVNAGVSSLMIEADFLVREMGYTSEEATAICDAAIQQIAEEEQEAEEAREKAVELGFGGGEEGNEGNPFKGEEEE